MLDFLCPTYYFHSIHDVDSSFFSDNSIKGILFDIDNTLEPYETLLPSRKTLELFERLKENGIKAAVISNNHEKRVKEFCERLDVSYSFDSAKPSSKKIISAIANLDLTPNDVVLVGDQLFTDIWGANNAKIKSIFVDRINDNESFFIKLKRLLEVPFVSKVKKKGYGRIK